MKIIEEKDRSEELAPCPFCGEDHVTQVFNGSDQYISSFWVMCGNCDAEGPVDKTEDGAVEKWNNRCKYAPEIPIEQTYGQKATDCCGVKNDEGDYVAAARKETFEKLEPLRKALFNIARDSEVSCNTKNCKLYSSKAEQNCNGINSGVSPSINDCPKYTPEVIRDGLYPCDDCGKMRTKAQGGTTFTICDVCWDKRFKHPQPPGDAQ